MVRLEHFIEHRRHDHDQRHRFNGAVGHRKQFEHHHLYNLLHPEGNMSIINLTITTYAESGLLDGLTAGSTKIQDAETKNFYPILAHLQAVNVSGSILGLEAALVSIGTNSTSYNNILAATLLPLVPGFGVTIPLTGAAYNNVDVYCKVIIPGIGSQYDFRATLISMHS